MLILVGDKKILSDGREIIKIAVTRDAKDTVQAFARRFDMTEIGVASRLYRWFASQPESIQKWVAGLTTGEEGAGMRDFAESVLKPPMKYKGHQRLRRTHNPVFIPANLHNKCPHATISFRPQDRFREECICRNIHYKLPMPSRQFVHKD